jgi:nitrate reductase gamma subunit
VAQLPYLFCYLALIVFTIAVIGRIVFWSKLPMHLRWELYPVAHEPANKVRYGGSFMEESEWWTKPRQVSRLGELKVMLPEILFLSAVKEHNRKLWSRTFPFHFGLYLAGAAATLTLLVGILRAVAPSLLVDEAGDVARNVIVVLGVTGLGLGVIGALGLLHRRLTEPGFREFTVPADIFNLIFFVAAFGSGILCFTVVDESAQKALDFATNLASLNMVALPGVGLQVFLPTTTVVLLSLLVAYIPLTHMSHFVGKYFAYHAIRWNDEPNLGGGPQEPEIQRLLSYKVSWAAQHIRGEGKKSWIDVALEDPTENEK